MRGSAGGGQRNRMILNAQRVVREFDIAVPQGYTVEAVVTGLTFPTGVVFDDAGRLHIIESGYSYGEVWTTTQLLRIDERGGETKIAEGRSGPWTGAVFHNGNFYVAGRLRDGRRAYSARFS